MSCIIKFGKYKDKTLEYIKNNDEKYFKWLYTIDTFGELNEELKKYKTRETNRINNKVRNAIRKVNQLANEGKIVYYINVHCVGSEFRIGWGKDGVDIENIMGQNFSLNNEHISKKQYEKIEKVMNEIWEKQGKHTKDRGLY